MDLAHNMNTQSAATELVQPSRKRWWAVLQRDDWVVVGRVMAIKVLVFTLAIKSYPIFLGQVPERSTSMAHRWLIGSEEYLHA
jgi:hypothetical protein